MRFIQVGALIAMTLSIRATGFEPETMTDGYARNAEGVFGYES